MIPAPKLSPSEPVPFREAIEWFQQQAPWISGSSWATMAGLAAYKGDQVSASILLSMVDDVFTQMDKAVVEGLPYGGFVRNMAEHLDAKWYAIDSPRLKLIYHNNVGNALMAGREAQLTDPDVMEAMPFWLVDAIMDFRTSTICVERDGIILPANDPRWKTTIGTPLYHHGCRTGIIALDKEDAADLGGVTPVSKLALLQPAQKGWGKPASWIDWKPQSEDYHPALFQEFRSWASGETYARTRDEWLDNLESSWGKTIPIGVIEMPESWIEPLAVDLQKKRVERKKEDIETTIRKFLQTWVIGSKRRSSVVAKMAAINEFGLSGVPYSRVQWNIKPSEPIALQPALRELYTRTQAELKKMHPFGTVTLYRGITQGYAINGALESWSTDYDTALKFDGGKNGDVLQVDIPIEHVLAFSGGPLWTNGKYGEQYEYVVLSSWMDANENIDD